LSASATSALRDDAVRWQNPEDNCHITPKEKRLRSRPRTRWSDYISDLAWSRLGEETAELTEIAVDSGCFQVLLRMLTPPHYPQEKRV